MRRRRRLGRRILRWSRSRWIELKILSRRKSVLESSGVPTGRYFISRFFPGAEAPGYCRPYLRDASRTWHRQNSRFLTGPSARFGKTKLVWDGMIGAFGGPGWLLGKCKGRPRKPLAEVLLGAPRCAPLRLGFRYAPGVPSVSCSKYRTLVRQAL
jgi:hypothetical protein